MLCLSRIRPSRVSLRVACPKLRRCAKQCCTNKKDFCLSGADHDGASCAKSSDPAECCHDKHENCIMHAANGRNCAFSPLCSEKEKEEAVGTYADTNPNGKSSADVKFAEKVNTPAEKWSRMHGKVKPNGGDSSAKEAAAAKAEAAAARDDEKTEKAQQAQQLAQPNAQATQELSSSGRNLRELVEPCAKQCCTNKKNFCLSGADHDGAACAKSSDPAECCEGRLDSCCARRHRNATAPMASSCMASWRAFPTSAPLRDACTLPRCVQPGGACTGARGKPRASRVPT